MAYSLSFSPEFFLAEGEPYDRPDLALNSEGNPVSVYSALQKMSDEDWEAMCEDLFPEVEPDFVNPEDLLEIIQETDTCSNLNSPVEVWIDPEGNHRVLVYEEDR